MIQTGFAEFGASDNGAVALHGGVSTTELVQLDRQGRDIGLIGDRAAHGVLRLDGSGRLLAVEVYDPKLGSRDIWIHDLELGTARRLTLGSSDDTDPIWWPDGQQVVFASDMAGAPDIYKVSLMGGGEAEPIVSAPPPLEPKDVFGSPARVMYMMWSRATNADLWVADPGVPGSSEPYLKTAHSESDARVSPGDRWVAFTSDETGSYEVYVARSGDASTRRRISVSGGWSPVWKGDGRELYFLGPGGAMVALFDPDDGTLEGPPKLLFAIDDPVWRGAWDVAPDGTKFVINRTVVDRRRDPIRVILDWPGLISHSRSRGGTS
jgi:dipeptidyl aminopeptidase/acylaminoacyl peptidase